MSVEHTIPFVLALEDPMATLELVGGKGASLARLAIAGLPVPIGFHVTTAAYRRFVNAHDLQPQILAAVSPTSAGKPVPLEVAAEQIQQLFAQHEMPDDIAATIRAAYVQLGDGTLPVAVRSSATTEDLADLSFAGQHETYLNIQGLASVLEAVKRCWASLWTGRAIDYRAQHDIMPQEVSLAVVIQQLIAADAAGILFTANPVTGSSQQIVINASWGLGEAIVSGLVTPDTIVVEKVGRTIIDQQINEKLVMTMRGADGTYEAPVPADRGMLAVLSTAQVAELAGIGLRIEKLYGQPMDIEWALQGERFFVLQARPITALPTDQAVMDAWNDSLTGDYLWTSTNLGEAVPDVMTPCTWSLMRIFMSETMSLASVGKHQLVGRIGGRGYLNLSVAASAATAFGLSKLFKQASVEAFGRIPEELTIPPLPMSRWQVVRELLSTIVGFLFRVRAAQRNLEALLAAAPARAQQLHEQITSAAGAPELLRLWESSVEPFFRQCSLLLAAGARQDGAALARIRKQVRKLVSEEDTNALLSGLHSGSTQLASLGPVVGLAQVKRGELDRASYIREWGHRSPHEFEVSIARPAEDPDWIEKQLAELNNVTDDATMLLARQAQARAAVWQRFQERYPRRAPAMQRRMERAAGAARAREAARSEVIRAFGMLRAYVLRAGEITGHSDDLFFLSIKEILVVLGGDDTPLANISTQRTIYERYRSLPLYPTLIRGRFDPIRWAADPHRRSDLYDEHGMSFPISQTITGFPGATGVVEGPARVIATAEEGDQLQAGEILVTTVTNVGWTPLFPRAVAVVTDVGAPLSHAAIVARELGIPAVVGCGNATILLHTGDQLRVDGGQGTVEVLRSAPS